MLISLKDPEYIRLHLMKIHERFLHVILVIIVLNLIKITFYRDENIILPAENTI